MVITTFAQNFEDVVLWRALGHVLNGHYIDIGAHEPVRDSVSKAFYERGWRGIHVEPSATYAAMLRQDRPDEMVLEALVADSAGLLPFFEIPGTGLSTAVEDIAIRHGASGWKSTRSHVPAVTLDDVLQLAPDGIVHWLKIDVEGFEAAVLHGWKTSPIRPWTIVIESTAPLSQTPTHEAWEAMVLAKGYTYVLSDGLNRFYLSDEHPELARALAAGPNVFDGFQIHEDFWASAAMRERFDSSLAAKQAQVEQFRAREQDARVELEALSQRSTEREDALTAELHSAVKRQEVLLAEFAEKDAAWVERLRSTEQSMRDANVDEKKFSEGLVASVEALQERLKQSGVEAADREGSLQAVFQNEVAKLQGQLWDVSRELLARERSYAEKLEQAHKEAKFEAANRTEANAALAQRLLNELVALQDNTKADAAAFSAEIRGLHTNAYAAQELIGRTHGSIESFALRAKAAELELRRLSEINLRLSEKSGQLATALDSALSEIKLLKEHATAFESFKEQAQRTELDLRAALSEGHRVFARAKAELDLLHGRWPLKLFGNRSSARNQIDWTFPSQEAIARGHSSTHVSDGPQPLPQAAANPNEALTHSSNPFPSDAMAHQGNHPDQPINPTSLPELLATRNKQFICAAYQQVLARLPDPEGERYYSARLKNGTSKLQILAQLRFSKEGQSRDQSAELESALRRYRRAIHPLFGWIFRAAYGTEGNGSVEKKLRAIEEQLAQQGDEAKRLLWQISASIGRGQATSTEPTQVNEPAVEEVSAIEKSLEAVAPRVRKIYFQLQAASAHAAKAI
ncbi:MAG: FkbM family methyltransferase [Ramlibacter sp.]|nr:FkbM family methyltransferase [Ramlibacter sp.]